MGLSLSLFKITRLSRSYIGGQMVPILVDWEPHIHCLCCLEFGQCRLFIGGIRIELGNSEQDLECTEAVV